MPEPIPSELLEFLIARLHPCLLLCDGTGRVKARRCHPESRVPPDIQGAESLDRCLSRPVRDEWIEAIRESICGNHWIEAVVVLDGAGFELCVVPTRDQDPARGAWLHLQPMQGMAMAPSGARRLAMRHHEWGSLDALSRCQLDTLRHITCGLSNQQIADRVHRSKRAVEWHIRHLHRLLGAGTRECLARCGRLAALDRFLDQEWSDVLATRPARRSLEEFALPVPGGRAA